MKIKETKVPEITPDRVHNIYGREIGEIIDRFCRPGHALGPAGFPLVLVGWRYVSGQPTAVRLTVGDRRSAWELQRIMDRTGVQDFLRCMFDYTDESFKASYGEDRREQIRKYLTQAGCRSDPNSRGSLAVVALPKFFQGNDLRPKDLTPRAGERWIAVEIEAVFPEAITTKVLLKRFYEAKLWGVCVKDDGSISPKGGQIGHEVVLCRPRMGCEVALHRLCLLLQQLGATVNTSCGLHVHFDMRGAADTAVEARATLLEKHMQHVILMLPPSRRNKTGAGGCAPGLDWSDRYHRVNLNAFRKYDTLEIRVHSGTCDFTKIINWIQLLEVLMHWPLRRAITFETWLSSLPLSDSARDYWKARARQFSGDGEHVVRTLSEDSEIVPLTRRS